MESGFINVFRKLTRRPVFLCLTVFLVCFILAFVFSLPLDQLARQVEQQAKKQGLELQIDNPQLRFPLGLGAEQLQVSHALLVHPPFQFQAVSLHPQWLSLISNNPGLRFDLEAYQGQINGSATRDGNVQATFSQLQFQEPLGSQLPLVLAGVLEEGEFAGQLPLAGKNRSRLQLKLNNLRLNGMQKIGSRSDILQLGTLTGTAESNGPVVQLSNFLITGPGFDLTGSGSLRLGRTAANSKLNLRLILTPKSALDPTLKDMLSLLKKPRPDGSYQLNLSGMLSSVRLN